MKMLVKEICERCGNTFDAGPNAHFCMRMRKKRRIPIQYTSLSGKRKTAVCAAFTASNKKIGFF